ncbi:MAG: PTS sugar transporter subunit IIC [Longicatena sp.]
MTDNLMLQTVLITLVALFGYMHNWLGSTMWNRPIVVSALTGLVLGDLTTGIITGATLELIFLGAVPIGASNPPDTTSGAIIGTSFVILSGQEIGAAVALAIPVATLVLLIGNVFMMFVVPEAVHLADRYAKNGDCNKVNMVAIATSLGYRLAQAIIVGIGFYIGVPVIKDILDFVPKFIIDGMNVAAGVLPAIGFAMLAKMIVSKELSPFLLIGFLLAAYLKVPVFGVALSGLAIASIIFFKDSKNQKEVIVDENEF